MINYQDRRLPRGSKLVTNHFTHINHSHPKAMASFGPYTLDRQNCKNNSILVGMYVIECILPAHIETLKAWNFTHDSLQDSTSYTE